MGEGASALASLQPRLLLPCPAACWLLPPTAPAAPLPAPAGAQLDAAAAGDQVADLQATLDAVLTELDIARSLLASQRRQDALALEGGGGDWGGADAGGGLGGGQRLLAFPVRLGRLEFHPEASGAGAGC